MTQEVFPQRSLPTFVSRVKSPQARRLLDIGKINHWDFRVLGQAPYPEFPVYTGDYWIVPLEEERQPMPRWVVGRAMAVLDSGVPLQGFVVVHEAPKVLEAKRQPPPPPQIPWEKIGKFAWMAAKVTGAIFALAGVALVAISTAVAFMMGAFILADPVLIAVTEDRTWVLIASWER
jgi:hypothetical protein